MIVDYEQLLNSVMVVLDETTPYETRRNLLPQDVFVYWESKKLRESGDIRQQIIDGLDNLENLDARTLLMLKDMLVDKG